MPLRIPRNPRTYLFDYRAEASAQASQIRRHLIRCGYGGAPDNTTGDEITTQSGALVFDPLRQKRVGISQPGDSGQKTSLRFGHQWHSRDCTLNDNGCTTILLT